MPQVRCSDLRSPSRAFATWLLDDSSDALYPAMTSAGHDDDALTQWLGAFAGPDDTVDAKTLSSILLDVDEEFFQELKPIRDGTAEESNKKDVEQIYALATAYYSNAFGKEAGSLSDTDFKDVAGLVLTLAVQSAKNEVYVARIQELSKSAQEELMQIIQRISPDTGQSPSKTLSKRLSFYPGFQTNESDDDPTTAYHELLSQYTQLKRRHEESLALISQLESDGAATSPRGMTMPKDPASFTEEDIHIQYKAEIDRLQAELLKTEGELAEAEDSSASLRSQIGSLEASLQETTNRAKEADKYKDQLDEYKHASDKLSRAENVIEKYKRKLEDSADLRRSLKALEEENANLVDQNARLEEAHAQANTLKPAVETYKSQVRDLEEQCARATKEVESLQFELSQSHAKLMAAEQAASRDSEAVQLYEERLKEIEREPGLSRRRKSRTDSGQEAESASISDEDDVLSTEDSFHASTSTMTDLRLQIRRLERQLKDVSSNNSGTSRLVIVENLLEDAERMRRKYENDYLNEHRETLRLNAVLEDIRSGSGATDSTSPEVVIALRQRLNETAEKLDAVRKSRAVIEEKLTKSDKELTVARSNLLLVDKSQLDVIKTLRAEVDVEKEGLESEISQLRSQISANQESSKSHQEQIKRLLLDKIDLQSDGIDQRSRALEREHAFSQLQASLSEKGLSNSDKEQLQTLQSEMTAKEKETIDLRDKLEKAKTFIRQQDVLARQKYGNGSADASSNDELQEKVRRLEAEAQQLKTNQRELEERHHSEQNALIQSWQQLSFDHLQQRTSSSYKQSQDGVANWLKRGSLVGR